MRASVSVFHIKTLTNLIQRHLLHANKEKKEEEEEGPFNVLSVNVQHLLGRTVFSSAMLTWRCFLRPDALPDTNTRAVLHE
jgi:hypothetical protein